ncbi:MAG TPA: hypothetical protein VMB81_14765 [Candidatus Sulfotelmatobacter sp.]|nr:hypothetical protein [Candidatus Sulfotelmatobacter sp.]
MRIDIAPALCPGGASAVKAASARLVSALSQRTIAAPGDLRDNPAIKSAMQATEDR